MADCDMSLTCDCILRHNLHKIIFQKNTQKLYKKVLLIKIFAPRKKAKPRLIYAGLYSCLEAMKEKNK